ncbi:hypothetical protein [Olleya sp. R77988]|uniref:hypothetical protein n=1 Tax=Olleya sp. R77988 TaxID=3093875 RepID=UPI0037CA7F8E
MYKPSQFLIVQEYTIYIHGLVVILACFFAGSNNFINIKKETLNGALFIFGFAFADLSSVTAYYLKVFPFYIVDRTFYVFALLFMVKYAINLRLETDY